MKGFVLSWFYPPGNSSEGTVTYKLLSHSKNQYDVFTRQLQNETIWDRKVEEKELTSKNINIIPYKHKNQADWLDHAVQYFLDHQSEYDFIMTRSMPPEAHEVAIRLKKQVPKLKWIASFGDPIIDTPYLYLESKDKNPHLLNVYKKEEKMSLYRSFRVGISLMRLAKKFIWEKERQIRNKEIIHNAKINEAVLKGADIVIFNNQYQKDLAFKKEYRHLSEKGFVLNHSYDKTLYPEITSKINKKKTFIYTGHLDDNRNARALLKAVKKLADNDSKLSEKVNFVFYGHMGAKDKLYIGEHNLQNIVKIHPDINYFESLSKMKSTDWLLLFDANFSRITDTNIFFPAKLADYIGAKKPILAITQLKGASADIIRKVGGGKIVSHSADEIFIYLSKIIYQNFKPNPINKKEAEEFDVVNVAKKLDKIIEDKYGSQ